MSLYFSCKMIPTPMATINGSTSQSGKPNPKPHINSQSSILYVFNYVEKKTFFL